MLNHTVAAARCLILPVLNHTVVAARCLILPVLNHTVGATFLPHFLSNFAIFCHIFSKFSKINNSKFKKNVFFYFEKWPAAGENAKAKNAKARFLLGAREF